MALLCSWLLLRTRLAALLAFVQIASGQIELKNSKVSFSFDSVPQPTGGVRLTLLAASVAGGAGGKASVLAPGGFSELWELQLLTPSGLALCSPSTATATSSSAVLKWGKAAVLTWVVTCSSAQFEVTQQWSLLPDADAASVSMRVRPCSGAAADKCHVLADAERATSAGGAAGLWSVSASVGAIPLGEAFYPLGFGETLRAGYADAGGHAYPGSGCTMQFMAAKGAAEGAGAVYFAAHDPAAHQKHLFAHEHGGPSHTGAEGRLMPPPDESAPLLGESAHALSCSDPFAPGAYPFRGGAGSAPGTQSLTITTLLEGAGSLLNSTGEWSRNQTRGGGLHCPTLTMPPRI